MGEFLGGDFFILFLFGVGGILGWGVFFILYYLLVCFFV